MQSETPQKPASDHLLLFMVEWGRQYLSCGGPTSRLEEALSALGIQMGFPTEVFATPTGIFVSCVDEHGTNRTTLARIKESGINFSRLCWLENIFEAVTLNQMTISHASKILNSKSIAKLPYTFKQTVIASFAAGFALSYPSFGFLKAALASGVISTATWWTSGPGLKKRVSSPIFRDFFGCIVTLLLASGFQLLLKVPFDSLTIGGLIILVPGLTITTAISELADQNLVSGTAKLMQGSLTLLALCLAYLLFNSMTDTLTTSEVLQKTARPLALGYSILGSLISVSCFGILFSVPKKSLPWSALSGVAGWLILRLVKDSGQVVVASYFASMMVGMISLYLGKRFKVPSQVYSVPGILAMLPGMLAFSSLQSIAMGNEKSGINLAFQVALSAGGIVFGLFTARIPFMVQLPRRFPIPHLPRIRAKKSKN